MPNWVRNVINVSGSEKDVDNFLAHIKNENTDFDFNTVIPMPKSLEVVSGDITDVSILYYLSNRLTAPVEEYENNDLLKEMRRFAFRSLREEIDRCREQVESGSLDGDKLYEQGRVYVDNFLKYGTPTWYEWCNKNWGTKWNACEVKVTRNNAGSCCVMFDTAWAAPFPVIEKLVRDFSNLEICGEWADEDMGNNCGIWRVLNGVLDCKEPDGDALKFACDVWEYDYGEVLGCMKNETTYESEF